MSRILAFCVALAALAAAAVVADSATDEAIRAQRQLIAADPGSAPLWNDLGNLMVTEGQLAEAESSYRRALELDSSDPEAHFNLALLLHESGRLDEAAEEYQRVLRDDPANAWAHYLLGSIHEERGERQAAVAAYAEAFSLDRRLLYPDVNPRIIGSRLVTEALLRSRSLPRVVLAPRSYADAERIGALLAAPGPAAETPPQGKAPSGKAGTKGKAPGERILDEDTLENVPATNQLKDAGKRPKRKRKNRG